MAQGRELDFMGRSHSICGVKVRTMKVHDFVVLSHMRNSAGGIGNPILFRGNPTALDMTMFLWVMQPRMPAYRNIMFHKLRAWAFGKKIGKMILEEDAREKFGLACFAYVDAMLRDAPSASGKSSAESCVSFLASWCNAMRDAYKCEEDEVVWMDLPKFFQYVRAIMKHHDSNHAQSNKMVDDLFQKVCDMINCGVPIDDIMSGKVELPSL